MPGLPLAGLNKTVVACHTGPGKGLTDISQEPDPPIDDVYFDRGVKKRWGERGREKEGGRERERRREGEREREGGRERERERRRERETGDKRNTMFFAVVVLSVEFYIISILYKN